MGGGGKEKISGSTAATGQLEMLRWERWKGGEIFLPMSGDMGGREMVCEEAFHFVPKKRC